MKEFIKKSIIACLLLTATFAAQAAGTQGSPVSINIGTVSAGGDGFTYSGNVVTITA